MEPVKRQAAAVVPRTVIAGPAVHAIARTARAVQRGRSIALKPIHAWRPAAVVVRPMPIAKVRPARFAIHRPVNAAVPVKFSARPMDNAQSQKNVHAVLMSPVTGMFRAPLILSATCIKKCAAPRR